MNLHDIDNPRPHIRSVNAWANEFFRLRNIWMAEAQVDTLVGATLNRVPLYPTPRWQDPYYRYDVMATDLLPNRVDGVFLEPERR